MKNLINRLIPIIILFWIYSTNLLAQQPRKIVNYDAVNISCPVGTVPRLPFQVKVTYSDNSTAYRQARWENAGLATEQEQANTTLYPIGKKYIIKGYIIGDETTNDGYPIQADITVCQNFYPTPHHQPIAETLPLNKVSVDGNNRLTSNRDMAIREILSWDVSQQLYNYRDTYGLSTEGYKVADGWDSPTTKLKGHGSGHYMSALAFAFASATDKTQKDALRNNIKRMVDELRLCQERTFVWNDSLGRYWEARDFAPEHQLREMKGTWEAFNHHKKEWASYGYGYLNAIPAHHAALIEMYRGYNNEAWVWAPYYAIHKQLAGLIDIATYIDDKKTAHKAYLIAKDMGLWIWNRLHYRTFVKEDGTREERRAKPGNRYEMWNMYIAGEDGGTGESLARLAEMTDNKEEKAQLIEASNYFDSPAFYTPLYKNIDDIRTRHANQHIPKITSALRSFRTNANPYYYHLAENFWNLVQGRYCYSTGGVGNGEMFRQPYTQILSMNTNVSMNHQRELCPNPTLNETCCAYNLAKLTKDLNCYDPNNAEYMDYYERVMYNQIIGSLHPTRYLTTYHYAVGLNASKPWGNRTPQESCCGGTGSESHVKYQEAAYFVSNDCLWVALYLPSTAQWEKKGVTIEQECSWPAERSIIRIKEGKGRFAMKLRIPYWATEGVSITLNGQPVATNYAPCSYVCIPKRKWKEGDIVEIHLPFTKHINYGPDKMTTAATAPGKTNTPFSPMWVGTLMYGPLAMTTTGIDHWNDATLTTDSRLSNIRAHGASSEEGTNGHLYTLNVNGHTFIPDYMMDRNGTHYLRIMTTDTERRETTQTSDIHKEALLELFKVVEERKTAQEAWHALTVKVPDHAPWAPHAYQRLMVQYEKAKTLAEGNATQAAINATTAALNAAINTMRPGNLPELEDLNELLPLLEKVKQVPHTTKTTEAIAYAQMVVEYVSDGSGTKDMIEKAVKQLRLCLK